MFASLLATVLIGALDGDWPRAGLVGGLGLLAAGVLGVAAWWHGRRPPGASGPEA